MLWGTPSSQYSSGLDRAHGLGNHGIQGERRACDGFDPATRPLRAPKKLAITPTKKQLPIVAGLGNAALSGNHVMGAEVCSSSP
jgi:hypothetical protein